MFKYCILFILFLACCVECNGSSLCDRDREDAILYLNFTIAMLQAVMNAYPACDNRAADCAEIQQMGYNSSGVYTIWPINRLFDNRSIDVYCDMETDEGGWTVIQRRGNFGRHKDYFFKKWHSYKKGFGNLREDFWLGNDNIFALTNQKLYSARFDLKDVEGNTTYAHYEKFWIDDENEKYTLHISDYSGDAGDSMIKEHNNQNFTTKDQDNDQFDGVNCAEAFKGAWWYRYCHESNLNGLYLRGTHESFADGVNWYTWKGYHESLEWTEIKIRPKSYKTLDDDICDTCDD